MKRGSRELREELTRILLDYERLIDETDVRYKQLMREECRGSISMLRGILVELTDVDDDDDDDKT